MNSNRTRRRSASPIASNRWLAYATAGAATALGGAASAEAGLNVIDVNQTFNAAAGGIAVAYFGLATGQSFGVAHQRTSSGVYGIAKFGIFGGGVFNGFSAGGFPYVAKLGFGANIAGGPFAAANVGTLAFGPGFANSQWTTPGQGYVGFKFTDTAGTEYGWASLTMAGVPGNVFTLNSYAYTTAGEIITAGQTSAVPEPGSLALLAMGGAGLLAWRQRRAAKSSVALPCCGNA